MITQIEYGGRLVGDCTLAGERREDDVFPGHINGTQGSAKTWLLIYCTRGWRAVDDDRSVVLQIRRDRPDGPLVRERMLAASINDWDALGDGKVYIRQQGHPNLFGVPRGAHLHGKRVEHENVFAALWRVKSKGILNPETGVIDAAPDAMEKTQSVMWTQFRLNDAEDDIEILEPPRPLLSENVQLPSGRQHLNIGFVQPIPTTGFGDRWAIPLHVSGSSTPNDRGASSLAAEVAWDGVTGRYQFTNASPSMKASALPCFEASIARHASGFVMAARSENAIGWVRSRDLFNEMPAPTFTTSPAVNAPIAVYTCADGELRLFTGDVATSPYGMGRNPLYCWRVDPLTFQCTDPMMAFDCIASGTLPESTIPRAEMCKLLPHAGGKTQTIVWRVRTKNVGVQYGSLRPVDDAMKQPHGLYYATVHYDRDYPGVWDFEGE